MKGLTFLLVCLQIGYVLSVSCQYGWVNFNNSCYHLSRSTATWFEATRMCEMHAGTLVHIESDTEQKFVTSLIAPVHSGNMFWIGATNWILGNVWAWEPMGSNLVYSNWRAGSPDNGNDEDSCAYIDRHRHGQWDDASCRHLYHYICESGESNEPAPVG